MGIRCIVACAVGLGGRAARPGAGHARRMPTRARWPAAPACWRSRRAATRCSWPGRAARTCRSSRSRSPEAPRARCSASTRPRAWFRSPPSCRHRRSGPRSSSRWGRAWGRPRRCRRSPARWRAAGSRCSPSPGPAVPERSGPQRQQADGDRIFTTESQGEDTRVVVRDPDPHEVTFAEGEDAYVARFAGDFVATILYGEPEQSRLVVRDWRTGVVTTSAEVPDDFDFIALRPDGRAAVVTADGALYDVPPGGPARPLATRSCSSAAAYAGDGLVHDPYGRASRDRPERALPGVRRAHAQPRGLRDRGHAGGVDRQRLPARRRRQRAARGGSGARTVRARRARPRRRHDQPNPYLTHRLPVALRCVAAPEVCRGKLRLGIGLPGRTKPISGRVPFSIPAGQSRSLRVPLTCRGYRMMLRKLRRGHACGRHAGRANRGRAALPGRPLVRGALRPG